MTSTEAPNHALKSKPGAVRSLLQNLSEGLVKNQCMPIVSCRSRQGSEPRQLARCTLISFPTSTLTSRTRCSTRCKQPRLRSACSATFHLCQGLTRPRSLQALHSQVVPLHKRTLTQNHDRRRVRLGHLLTHISSQPMIAPTAKPVCCLRSCPPARRQGERHLALKRAK
ncbi:uncharacterized protein EI90DRAFT_1110450 [Cantharellus anzutake]|uniref:uncharacterized protein n=1 Tax=Cantharellus anzutake TaxID=1750568 RepID=UPI001906F04B|nr:uncharacterized protein EI90DRAFT_1110450 [Cantharellus anzutake]KAF8330902.1 hypothetical protein EI90DRAFT_1110450 [Cantharellus anzutake]